MQREPHIGESAELYAAGALDAAERAAADAHAAACPQCLRRLGEAEETVLALERARVARATPRSAHDALPFRRTSAPRWWLGAGVAAAFLLGLVVPRGTPQPDVAALAMIQSHFSHAQFSGGGPPAKAIYARDRSWYYVIVGANRRYGVYGVRRGRAVPLGTLVPKGATSELFTRAAAPFDRIELRDGSAVVEGATIR